MSGGSPFYYFVHAMWGFGWPVNANRKVREPYASALNNSRDKLIETLKVSYAEGEGGGGIELGSLFIRMSLAIVTSQKEKRTTSAVAISKCQFLKLVFLDTETSLVFWFVPTGSPKYGVIKNIPRYYILNRPIRYEYCKNRWGVENRNLA